MHVFSAAGPDVISVGTLVQIDYQAAVNSAGLCELRLRILGPRFSKYRTEGSGIVLIPHNPVCWF